jgi:taurine dioxygenase
VRTHPETGRKAIFVNGIFTKQIVGMTESESAELLQALLAHATRDEFGVRHDWRPGDIAFWDNRCTQHRAMWDYWPHTRSGTRVTVKGERPV